MAFDAAKFRQTAWEPRTAEVRVPALAEFFGKEAPVFTVRGLDGNELSRMREQGERVKTLQELGSKLASGNADAVREAITGALEEDTPDEIWKYAYAVEHGVIEPKLERQDVMLLHKHHHGAFQLLAQKILLLSGEGSVAGKRKRSGGTSASKPT